MTDRAPPGRRASVDRRAHVPRATLAVMRLLTSSLAALLVLSCRTSPSPAPTVGSGSAAASDPARAAQAAAFRSGWSESPASPGPVFAGLVPGRPGAIADLYARYHPQFSTEYNWIPDGDNPELLAMFRDSRVVLHVELIGGVVTDLGLWTNDERDVGCPPELAPAIRAAWKGAPQVVMKELEVWLDPQRSIRALLSTGDQCRLEFERYLPVDAWLTQVARLDVVGKPATVLDSIPDRSGRLEAGSGTLTWGDPGCGLGGGITLVNAAVAGGTITAVTSHTYLADQTADSVRAALTARFGPPTAVTGLSVDRLEWRSATPPLRLDLDRSVSTLELVAGTPTAP